MADEMNEACGIFGCIGADDWPTNMDIPHIIYLGLMGLQHRGQESAGIVTTKGGPKTNFLSHKGQGLVANVFTERSLVNIKGNLGIGHTRYSTMGGMDHHNTQPFVVHTAHGQLAVAHNGELVNAAPLRRMLLKTIGLSTGSDSEILTQLLSQPLPDPEPEDAPDWPARLKKLMALTSVSYSLILMHNDTIYAARDPFGNRPLCLGRVSTSMLRSPSRDNPIDAYMVSSESCAFVSIGARLVREVEPGEIVKITKQGFESVCIVPRPDNKPPALCIFEYVYFAKADSYIEGQQVEEVRKECGRQLAREALVEADLVSCVPESSIPAARGFSEKSGVPFADVLCKNRYVGRTFIEPTTYLRQLAVAKKFGPLTECFKGKRIILIDDSIVRGTTIRSIITMLKDNGAKEVHVRVASPPLYHPCYMGINIPTSEELVANTFNSTQLANEIGADSLVYLSLDGLKSAVRKNIKSNGRAIGHCTACLTGEYPVELQW
ncbi:PPAT [Cordylochernes scorpioides]|uniref:Amidophosphoribosyltransferase n=1 Tax=Cordylochernes scorpioides TaxID=51811 RepID=A0ABY6K193_9ARAC|nr:PPAT [Cordylochernes scorpioides]